MEKVRKQRVMYSVPLRDFLLKNRIFKKFNRNLREHYKRALKEEREFTFDALDIYTSFVFTNTPEGWEYWIKVHTNWVKYCDEKGIPTVDGVILR